MRILGEREGVWVFAPTIRESDDMKNVTKRVQEYFIELFGTPVHYSYIVLISDKDLRANGHRDLVNSLVEEVNWKTHNLIIVKTQ